MERSRREFLKEIAFYSSSAYLATLGIQSFPTKEAQASSTNKIDIGECKSVKIKAISELGWWDNKTLIHDIKTHGGIHRSQWEIPWTPRNAAGSCSLIEVTALDGKKMTILIDTGWNIDWMRKRFKEEGIDKMLREKKIDYLYITHEHLDHYWGLEATLENDPTINMLIPSTFYPEGMHFLEGAQYLLTHAKNLVPYKGKLAQLEPGKVHKLFPGVASITLDFPIIVRIKGEQSLYFNVKDKGIVIVTGCCHRGILYLAELSKKTFKNGDNLYGIYGGLHIDPFEKWSPKAQKVVKDLGKYNFKKIAANHCTGHKAIHQMIALGYPVARGTGRNGSKSKEYIGNGDTVMF